MTVSNDFFVIRDACKTKDQLIIEGDFIINGRLEAGPGKTRRSSIGFPPQLEVKWILPPKDSLIYKWVKQQAEDAGYDTVEHDDFSYPPERG